MFAAAVSPCFCDGKEEEEEEGSDAKTTPRLVSSRAGKASSLPLHETERIGCVELSILPLGREQRKEKETKGMELKQREEKKRIRKLIKVIEADESDPSLIDV